jgi:D-amino-acid dehydrogenase
MIAVIGAGIVGTTTALMLKKRGIDTILIDKGDPGMETSFGNAGVLSESSIIVANNPQIIKKLPKLLLSKDSGLRLDPKFILSHLGWMINFLKKSTEKNMLSAAVGLRALHLNSLPVHKSLLAECNNPSVLRDSGWLKIYRTLQGYEASQGEREFFDKMGVSYLNLSKDDIQELEPSLNPIYHAGVLANETSSVTSPLKLTQSYFKLFKEYGGQFKQNEIVQIKPIQNNRWNIKLKNESDLNVDGVVIAAGPWSTEVCKMLEVKIPMAWERGYHTHLEGSPNGLLNRPVYDVERAFVMTTVDNSIRISSGVELAKRDAAPNYQQINSAMKYAREASNFGNSIDPKPWMGSRPTMPDCLPLIGASSKLKNIWYNTGHQHVGLSTSTGSANLLADIIEDKTTDKDFNVFSPTRFNL